MREYREWNTSASCLKHLSSHGGAGVCASCLRERLLALCSASNPSSSLPSAPSTSSAISHRPFVAAASGANTEAGRFDAGSDETIQRLIQADRKQCRSGSKLDKEGSIQPNEIPFGRSVSWSQSKASTRSHGLAASTLPSSSNPVNHRTSKAFSALPFQNSASFHAEVVSTTKTKQQQTKSFSSLFSLIHLRSGRSKAPSSSTSSSSVCKSKASKSRTERECGFNNQYSDTSVFEKRIRNEWEGGETDGLYRFDFFKQQDKNLPLRVQLDDQRGGVWKPWATPLRIFSSKSRKAKQLEVDDTTAIPSSFSYRPSPAAYSAFHKDHGSLSLYSSPMPGGKMPSQDGRSEMFCFSPYAGGDRPWNFYLTPVRPIKSASNPKI